MVQSIEVFLQPPSPVINATCQLPSVKTLFSANMDNSLEGGNSQERQSHEQTQQQHRQLPSIRLTEDHSANTQEGDMNKMYVKKLNTIEPRPDSLSISTSPYQQSPIMTFSSPCSTTSSMMGSPLISPIQDGPFLLPPPDSSFRRCRSVSNASNASSPCNSPYVSFSFRSLSEPPTLNLPPSSTDDEEEDDDRSLTTENYHPIFGPKRKRGRPPNASRPDTQSDSNWTFVKPTVWDVKHNKNQQSSTPSSPSPIHQQQQIKLNARHSHSNTNTPQFFTENKNTVMAEGINTFTANNMNMALSIPKKKRGRKPKKQLAGNSCFVWKDLTAPRGANKKTLLLAKNGSNGNSKKKDLPDNRALLPASSSIKKP